MTWNTPLGLRVLEEPEAEVMRVAIHSLASQYIHGFSWNKTRVPVFEEMSTCQKLVMLEYVKTHLLEKTRSGNEENGIVIGTVEAAIERFTYFIMAEWQEEHELLAEGKKPSRFWRGLLRKVSKAYKWNLDFKQKLHCQLAIERLRERILRDIPEGVPIGKPLPEPKDAQGMLDLIHRLMKRADV